MRYQIVGKTFEATPESCDVFNSFLEGHPAANDTSHWGMVEELKTFVERTKDKHMFVDVGALFGLFSLVFADGPHKRAIAIEPSPWAYPTLKENTMLNPHKNITASDKFLGEDGETVVAGRDWKHLVAGVFDKGYADRFTTKAIKLDNVVAWPCDCMKIDVEGYEVKVLKGAKEIITKHKPMIFLEYHALEVPLHGDSLQDLYRLLTDYGYSIKYYNGETVKEFAANSPNRVICTYEV